MHKFITALPDTMNKFDFTPVMKIEPRLDWHISLQGGEESSCSASLSFHDIVAGSSMKHTRLLITPFAVLKGIAVH